MRYIQHIHEPRKLLVMWQAGDMYKTTPLMRTRRSVAEISPSDQGYSLRYLDCQDSIKYGFTGVAPFPIEGCIHNHNVMDALAKRLPSQKRGDFKDFLDKFRLPHDFSGSTFALLGYTGGRLPSDRLDFVPDFSHVTDPIDLFLEVVGIRYYTKDSNILQSMRVDDLLQLKAEKGNEYDNHAIAVFFQGQQIGYLNRGVSSWMYAWLEKGRGVYARISRFNGSPDRPVIYVLCSFEATAL